MEKSVSNSGLDQKKKKKKGLHFWEIKIVGLEPDLAESRV